jgi:hypothetical protein
MRAVFVVAVGNHPLAVDTRDSTARTKSLEIAVFPTVRSMRAVFHEVLPARRTPLSSPQFSRID